jgi:hypothetical protein
VPGVRINDRRGSSTITANAEIESNQHPVSQNATEALRSISFDIGPDIMLISSVMEIASEVGVS